MPHQPPKVFISYSHDSTKHAQHVLELAERLRKDGIDAQLDQYVAGTPAEGWPRWMLNRLDWADFVLVTCTETYYRRFRGHEEDRGKGKGADWEANLITLEMYDAKSKTTKFAPVSFASQDEQFIPEALRGHTQYLLNSEENYAKLYAFLTGQAGVKPGELGSLKTLARNLVEPLGFEVSDRAARQLLLSNLPDRNPFFTGRETVLAQLHEALAARGRAALSGLGGVGKTQMAVEYAHQHLNEYDYILWVTADSREAIISGYTTLAGLLKLPEADAQDQILAVEAVQRWLSSHQGWLLLLDNADDLGVAREFIPAENNGHVFLTTQAQDLGAIARRVPIREMRTEEGTLFLLRRAKYIAEHSPLEVSEAGDRSVAEKITIQLDGLPLALDQAGAYIEETGCGLAGYLDLYRNHAPELLQHRGALASDHPDPVTSTRALWLKRLLGYLRLYHRGVPELLRHRRVPAIDHPPVATTWALSLDKIEQANPSATEILKLCAFLHPDGIPEELFRDGIFGQALEVVSSDALAWNNAISEILKYSLLRRDPKAATLEIHRLVQAVLKQGMDEVTQRRWAERAVRTVEHASPPVEFSTWAVCERLLPQAYACAELINRWGFEFPEAARPLNHAGFYLYKRARYTDAKPLCEQALAILENALGPDHFEVANSLDTLAELYRAQGEYAKAEPLYRRALAIYENTPGQESTDVAKILNNLAELYRTQGQYAKAEPLYRRALAIYEKAPGQKPREVATSLDNLAVNYGAQGQYAKAGPLHERALAIYENALGPEHPDVAISLSNLAGFYYSQGQYAKAEPLYQRALAIWDTTPGPEHPDAATSLNNLAALYCAQDQYAKAEPLLQRALAIWERVLGPDHRNVATSLRHLALLYRDQGQYTKAESVFERALTIREKALEPDHPDLATSLNDAAALYCFQRQYAKAEPLYQRALAIREKALGPEHADVATILNSLAVHYFEQGQYAKAEPLYQRALAILEKALGQGHPNVATSLSNMAVLYASQGQYAKAEPLYQRALVIREKVLGPEHPDVAVTLDNCAFCLRAMDRSQEAKLLKARARAIRAKSA
jgi:tetratricopeptide (TPR) repeat protein